MKILHILQILMMVEMDIYYHFKVENLEEIRFNYSESDITFLEKENLDLIFLYY